MQPSNLGAVIFDMDGVIVDSEPRHERAYLEVARAIGYGHNHGLRFADYIGRSDTELWVDFVKRNHPAQTLDELLAMKRARVIDILRREEPVFEGVPERVRTLAAICPLALASGSERQVVEAVLSLKELGLYLTAIVSGSDVKRGKPAPDIFLRAAELLKVPPADCWVVEDSKHGIAAAKAAGMRVIAITNTYPAAELQNAEHVATNYAEIGALFSQLLCET
jgi:beta-phosphoglucomutase-like phosphatase (HAD superfamily)